MNFDDFLKAARGTTESAFDYQRRLACGERNGRTEGDWLGNPDADGCRSRLINIPTGLGKTAAVVLAWLWNRVQLRTVKSEVRNPEWPRRLVYCLPMRTLVEQTQGEVKKWLENLARSADKLGLSEDAKTELRWLVDHSPVILMGGEEPEENQREWDCWPEKACILIGTQDMLLSRALNRGYLRVQSGTGNNAVFRTSSTLDGHRFASDFLARAEGDFGNGRERLAAFIIRTLGMNANGSTMPIARIPEVFQMVMELDPMSLVHGFQISNEQISFVGLRLPRALTASIIGFNCERVAVPGIKFSTEQAESQSGQAIFQKQRITSGRIEARFSIDVGLLASLRLDAPQNGQIGQNQRCRFELLVSIALWKVSSFLHELSVELSLRSECKLRLKGNPRFSAEGAGQSSGTFPYATIAAETFGGPQGGITQAHLPPNRHPFVLQFNS